MRVSWDDDEWAAVAPGWHASVHRLWLGKPPRLDRHPPAAGWRLWGPESDHPFEAALHGEVRARNLDEDGYATDDPMPRARDLAMHFLGAAQEQGVAPHQHVRGAHRAPEKQDIRPAKVLIGCCKDKVKKGKHKPMALYLGPQFKMRAKWAEILHGGVSGVLSSKYGLVLPDDQIEYYDLQVSKFDKEEKARWESMVRDQVRRAFPKGTRIIVLAGKDYGGWQTTDHDVEHRRFGGIGRERKVLTEEMAEALRGQVEMFEGAA